MPEGEKCFELFGILNEKKYLCILQKTQPMATKKEELTPMMKQFFSLKAKHPDALLLFRCGDFYETYCDDAIAASQILGITLTRRNNGAQGKTNRWPITC